MLEKLLNCKLVYALVALVLSFLMILQEESLGSSNIWAIALCVAAGVGLVLEVVNYFKFTGRFQLVKRFVGTGRRNSSDCNSTSEMGKLLDFLKNKQPL
jgi:hypothetical protein